MNEWDQKIQELKKLHEELQRKPPSERKDFDLDPKGILTAYLEGDISLENACTLLKVELTRVIND